MQKNVTKEELSARLRNFCKAMNAAKPDWDTAMILGKINQYYFTGTMQDGLLIIKKSCDISFYVRRSYERAVDESPISEIFQMESYRDAAQISGADCGNTYVETEIVTLGMIERLKKHFKMDQIGSLDKVVLTVRSVKSPYELTWMERSGKQHNDFVHNIIPAMLREGISEADLVAEIFEKMVKHGHQGISRFSTFQTEMVAGQVGFGESSLYPTNFDGPGGSLGMSPAVPFLGNRDRKLKNGDLVFIDIGFGMNGYHSDKTQVYMFGKKPADEIIKAHRMCMDIESRLAERLKPGAIPSALYHEMMASLDDAFKQNFMGYGSRQVKFLGHGIGLYVDELPVIANGFHEPLVENVTIALEPKKGIEKVGMVGVEDTYIVTNDGGRCITGGGSDIIVV